MAQQPLQQYGTQESTGRQTDIGTQSQQPIQSQQSSIGQSDQQFGQTQQPIGGQQVGQGSQMGAQRGVILEDGINDEMRVALHDFVQAANVSEWCAEQCIDEGPHMAECIRLCRDVADLASLNAKLLTRDSVFGPELAEVFAMAADEAAQECAQHPHKHCQECAEVLPRAARSTRKMLSSFSGGGGMQTQGSQMGMQAKSQTGMQSGSQMGMQSGQIGSSQGSQMGTQTSGQGMQSQGSQYDSPTGGQF